MKNNFDIESIIDLDSYSSSKGFLGYSEGIATNSDEVLKEFLCFLGKKKCHQCYSSLFITDDYSILKEVYNIEISVLKENHFKLIEKGIVTLIREDSIPAKFNPDEYNEYDSFLEEKQKCFNKLDMLSNHDLKLLFTTLLDLGGLVGHFFFLFDEEELLIYPHDDGAGGFGFIHYGSNQREVQDLLKQFFGTNTSVKLQLKKLPRNL